jgi:hypothetical protein
MLTVKYLFSRALLPLLLLLACLPVSAGPTPAPRAPAPSAAPDVKALTASLYRAAGDWIGAYRVGYAKETITHFEQDDTYMRFAAGKVTVSHDIQRTQSLVTPYLGTVVIEVRTKWTDKTQTEEEARTAPYREFYLPRRDLTYAYQNGKWVYKDEETSFTTEPLP